MKFFAIKEGPHTGVYQYETKAELQKLREMGEGTCFSSSGKNAALKFAGVKEVANRSQIAVDVPSEPLKFFAIPEGESRGVYQYTTRNQLQNLKKKGDGKTFNTNKQAALDYAGVTEIANKHQHVQGSSSVKYYAIPNGENKGVYQYRTESQKKKLKALGTGKFFAEDKKKALAYANVKEVANRDQAADAVPDVHVKFYAIPDGEARGVYQYTSKKQLKQLREKGEGKCFDSKKDDALAYAGVKEVANRKQTVAV